MFGGERMKHAGGVPFDMFVRTSTLPVRIGRTGMSTMLGLAGYPSGPQLRRRLKAEEPLHNARVGIQAVEDGTRRHDPELINSGRAQLVRAVVEAAHHDDDILARVTDEVSARVVEKGIDPFVTTLVPPEEAIEAAEALDMPRTAVMQGGEKAILLQPQSRSAEDLG
jgi:hypothetical protein